MHARDAVLRKLGVNHSKCGLYVLKGLRNFANLFRAHYARFEMIVEIAIDTLHPIWAWKR